MLLQRALVSAVAFAALLLAPSSALARSSVSADRFDGLLAKQLSAHGPIRLSDATFKGVTDAPRNFSAAILLTALDQRYGCKLCNDFQPEWNTLGSSWVKGDKTGESRLVIGTLDFSEGRETFTSLGLQTAPVLLFFPPTEGPYATANRDTVRFDFSGGAVGADHIRSWLTRHLPGRPHPELKRPFNWARFAVSIILLAGAGTAVVTAWSYIQPVVQSKNLWAGLGLTAILIFTSGHMFNQIRGVPYVAGKPRGGGVQYFAPSFQSQYGLETQVIAGVYGVLAFCAISLATRVPRITNTKLQTISVLLYSSVMFVAYSFLMSIFRLKNSGYPFSLPPFM